MTSNPYPRTGSIRGLLSRIRSGDVSETGRGLVRTLYQKRTRGVCCWCRQPCERNRSWHTECIGAYIAAKGLTVAPGGSPLISARNATCEECGGGKPLEIDHRVAVSVAREYRRLGYRRWWRAWIAGNLRWLCHDCHATKTQADRLLLKQCRALV